MIAPTTGNAEITSKQSYNSVCFCLILDTKKYFYWYQSSQYIPKISSIPLNRHQRPGPSLKSWCNPWFHVVFSSNSGPTFCASQQKSRLIKPVSIILIYWLIVFSLANYSLSFLSYADRNGIRRSTRLPVVAYLIQVSFRNVLLNASVHLFKLLSAFSFLSILSDIFHQ